MTKHLRVAAVLAALLAIIVGIGILIPAAKWITYENAWVYVLAATIILVFGIGVLVLFSLVSKEK